uniref:C2H2-type domain-containing protein n=1 Tax=Hucho hucho TaxID=62062 RepID=A0A4W5P865_9TELE
MSRRKQAKPRSVKAVEEGESSEFARNWDSSSVQTDVPAALDRKAARKERRAALEDGDHSVTSHDDRIGDDDLDDESIFTCDNCQQDFECLAKLTDHRTNHCPAGKTSYTH